MQRPEPAPALMLSAEAAGAEEEGDVAQPTADSAISPAHRAPINFLQCMTKPHFLVGAAGRPG